jgi:predicted amidohydrolase YtcJ
VLAEDPLACPLERLPVIAVEQTVVDGRMVYDRAHDGEPVLP